MKITRAVVPSLFTVLNMFCGFVSLIHSSEGQFDVAAWFIVLAGIFDSLDGVMARITKSSSSFGVEIDSLSDVISFGAAPAFLAYKLYLFHYEGIGILISALPLILGGIRLARFNVQLIGFDKDYFSGLPIPSSAITIVAYVLTYRNEVFGLRGLAADAFAPMIVIVSLLMVSKVKYDTLPKFTRKGWKHHRWRIILTTCAAVILVVTRMRALFFIFIFFILTGIIRWLYHGTRKMLGMVKVKEEEPDIEEATSYDV